MFNSFIAHISTIASFNLFDVNIKFEGDNISNKFIPHPTLSHRKQAK